MPKLTVDHIKASRLVNAQLEGLLGGSMNTAQNAPCGDEFYASTWLGSGAHLFGQDVSVKALHGCD